MIEVPLGGCRGGHALVDDLDEWVLGYRWSQDGRGYVQRNLVLSDGRRSVHTLHREVMAFPSGVLVDHINRNRLDCQRSNLRLVSPMGNAQNTSARTGYTSRFRGVYRHTQCARWVATATRNGKSIYLGLHGSEEAAAEVSRNWRLANMPGATD